MNWQPPYHRISTRVNNYPLIDEQFR